VKEIERTEIVKFVSSNLKKKVAYQSLYYVNILKKFWWAIIFDGGCCRKAEVNVQTEEWRENQEISKKQRDALSNNEIYEKRQRK